MNFSPPSVSELIQSIKNVLEENFQEVMVQGEVSNLSIASSGHCYFTLSDEDSSLSCAMFRGDILRNAYAKNIKNGDQLVIVGPVTVYQKRGQFQLLVKRLMPAGEGFLKIQFDQLKAKLAHEGLFDLDRKKKIPLFPKKIAVITSEKGAALQDFLNVIKRRSLWFNIVIIPSLVQGGEAPSSLIKALEKSEKIQDLDLIVITRGGGSLEDLWAFNDEALVRKMSESRVPLISAVGHQVDFTLSDFVADLRAETPTAAAEIISQPQTELEKRIQFCKTHLWSEFEKTLQRIELFKKKFHPKEILSLFWLSLQQAQKNLFELRIFDRGEELLNLPQKNRNLDEASLRLSFAIKNNLQKYQEISGRLEKILDVLNPNNTLKRGYTYLKDKNGKVISQRESFISLPTNEALEIIFYDGPARIHKE